MIIFILSFIIIQNVEFGLQVYFRGNVAGMAHSTYTKKQ